MMFYSIGARGCISRFNIQLVLTNRVLASFMISLKDGTFSCSLLKQDMEVVIPSADTPGGIGNYCGSEDVPEMAGLGISLLMSGYRW